MVCEAQTILTYPQSNGRKEFTVKTAKRIMNGNTGPKVPWIMTLLLELSSSTETPQHLCNSNSTADYDFITSQPIHYKPHPESEVVAQCCKEILHHRNTKIVERYTHNLSPL